VEGDTVTRKANPIDYVLVAFQPSTGAIGYWTGTNWDTDPEKALRAHSADTLDVFKRERGKTLPPGWRIGVQPAPDLPPVVKKNPSRRKKNPVPASQYAKMKEAIERYKEFTGMEPEFYDAWQVNHPEVGFVVGTLDAVLYTTVRDGITESYQHKFKKNSQPLLCSTHDGKQLVIVGGRYRFTNRGIVDKG
jgi:hypothetical protein